MCWKSHVQDPHPSPTPMAVADTTAQNPQNVANITEGGPACPELTTACSNITIDCNNNGLCCLHGDEPLCSCFSGWLEPHCEVEKFGSFENNGPMQRHPDVLPTGIQISPIFLHVDQPKGILKEAGTHQWIIGVVIGVLLVGLLIVVFFVYRKFRRTSSTRNLHRNGESRPPKPLLQMEEQNINGNDKGAS